MYLSKQPMSWMEHSKFYILFAPTLKEEPKVGRRTNFAYLNDVQGRDVEVVPFQRQLLAVIDQVVTPLSKEQMVIVLLVTATKSKNTNAAAPATIQHWSQI